MRVTYEPERVRLLAKIGQAALTATLPKVLDWWEAEDGEYDRMAIAQEAGSLAALAALSMLRDLEFHLETDTADDMAEMAAVVVAVENAKGRRRDDEAE